ncbi:hypothetical protein C8R43DRAFT_1147313, partial [Mycena crocata]
ALYDSAERPPQPSCYPGTRRKTLDSLCEWSSDGRQEGTFLWLNGSAGAGKSAIAQSFAAQCDMAGILGASFFFKRGDQSRGTWRYVFPTLAYQLAVSFSELHDFIQQAVDQDKLILRRAMRNQFQNLIVAPFKQVSSLRVRPIIIIDGLNECEGHDSQVMILQLLIEALRTGNLPARLLLASRPEPHLREVLEAAENFGICRHLELCNDAAAYSDVRRYLRHEFSRIRVVYTARGADLDVLWPGDAIEQLVQKSSGTFIYASTVVRYIDDGYSHPAERLESLLAFNPHSTAPLDDLYTQILSAVPKPALVRRVLHVVVRTNGDLDAEEINAALQVRGGTSRLALRALHSVVSVSPRQTIGFRNPVTLQHASLEDFLVDPGRSVTMCVTAPSKDLDGKLVRSMISALSIIRPNVLHFRSIAMNLLSCMVQVSPADDLLPVLRNPNVQHVYYLMANSAPPVVDWLQRYHYPPFELIEIWRNLDFIKTFVRSSLLPDTGTSRLPTLITINFTHSSCDKILTSSLSFAFVPSGRLRRTWRRCWSSLGLHGRSFNRYARYATSSAPTVRLTFEIPSSSSSVIPAERGPCTHRSKKFCNKRHCSVYPASRMFFPETSNCFIPTAPGLR